MATSSEIEAALVGRVKAILAETYGKPYQAHHLGVDVKALIQALAELMGDDEDDGPSLTAEKGGE